MSSKITLLTKIVVILLFLVVGLRYLITASQLASNSLPSEPTSTFLQTLYNGNSVMGAIEVSLSPNPSFVVGANITAQVTIVLGGASNNTYFIEILFPDALVVRDEPPYTWQQDWSFLLDNAPQINGTEQIQTLSNVTLVYAQEGIYGLNMTITQASTDTKMYFHFDNLVQIEPLSYLEDEARSNVTLALNFDILGLTLIMVAPVLVQLVDFSEKISEKSQSQKFNTDTPTKEEPRGSEMNETTPNETKPFDKDIELQKIQALESEFQSWFNIAGSFWIAGFLGIAILWVSLYYEGRLNFLKNVWWNMILVIVVLLIISVLLGISSTLRMKKVSDKFWIEIDKLLIKVEKEEPLGSLAELRQQIERKSRSSVFKML